ncbi:MAG: DUF2325 domain-containing protein [Proteobacteria bacterium]|nr:DUF2325 domain-containing protein [Pseudomonadota bacterium]
MGALLKEFGFHKESPCKGLKKRKSLWEIDHFYHCSIIGTCLTISEQEKILTKEKIFYKNFTLFEIHGIMISKAKEESRISRRVNNLLNRKYRKEVLEFSDCDERTLLSIWDEKLETGEICGLYWAAISNSDYSDEMLKRLFGDVHMLSHINGGEVRGSLKGAVRIKEENDELKRALKQEKETRRQMKKEIAALERDSAEMGAKYNNVIVENGRLTEELTEICSNRRVDKLEAENAALKNRLSQSEDELKKYAGLVESLKKEKKEMALNLSNLEEANNGFKSELNDTVQQFFSIFQQCDENCPAFDLCAKRILIVGGMTKLKFLYRDLVEEKGGVFDYHDGYMRGGEDILEEKVRRSDVVLCPVDVNSHNACLSVKRICKKIQKPYQMLSSSSLTSITRALIDVVVEPATGVEFR